MSNSLYYFIYKLLPNDTDFTVFKAAGYEGLNFALIGDVERYHTPQDDFAHLDLAQPPAPGAKRARCRAGAREQRSSRPASRAARCSSTS